MLRQYHDLKRQHPGTLLFFRLGDFYELFYDDAVTGARELEITLTARHKERGEAVPMCGVPHHSVAGYIARLVRKGYRVAICEQTEDPAKAKKLVRREVVRVITPGTAIDPQLMEASEAVYLAAVCGAGATYGAAFLELSTGEFRATEVNGPDSWDRIRADIESFAPRELLFPASLTLLVKDAFQGPAHTAPLPLENEQPVAQNAPAARITPPTINGSLPLTLTPLDDWLWQAESCASRLREQFGVRELSGYGLEGKTEALRAAGACLYYARETQRAAAAHIADITYFETQDHLVLDAVTIRNLELTEAQGSADRRRSLLGVIDASVTGMGSRLLRSWLLRPSIRLGEIEARLQAVEDLCAQIKRDRLRALLKEVCDLDRLIGRLHLGSATPRDLVALCRSLDQVPAIRQTLSDAAPSLLQILCESMDELPEVRGTIAQAISDEPPVNIADSDVIREGYAPELDELRAINRNAKQTIAALEARERARSGISSLRIRFNNVFGYFMEVSKASASRVPAHYERRQTLSNAERFTTPELKELEQRVRGADQMIVEMETSIFEEVRARVTSHTRELQATARALSTLDALCALAETAVRHRYVRPTLHDGDEMEITGGRHPLIESFSAEPFIPNDLHMNNSTARMLIITGPNMGGKCLRGDTYIFTERGLVSLKDLMPTGARVGTFAEIGCPVQARQGRSIANYFYTGGKQATIRITTRFGYEIEGTPEHRLWVRHPDGSEGWKQLADVTNGDMVAIDRRVDLWGQETSIDRSAAYSVKRGKRYRLPAEVNEDLAYIMGLLIGDGTLTYSGTFMLSTADTSIADEYQRIVEKLFGYRPARKRNSIDHAVHSKQIRIFLENLGLGYGRAHDKHVPHSILRAPKQIVIAFLQGLFDTDGWAANQQAKVFLATSSQRLAREVQLLLLNLGIVASLKVKPTKCQPSYQVAIYGEDAIRFHTQVGFRLPRKQARQQLASDLRMPNIGIPYLATTLKKVQADIVATTGKPVALKRNKSVNSIFYTYLPAKRNLSYRKLGELIDYCHQNFVLYPEIEAVQQHRYFYDRIVKIETGEADVYDLSVAHDHSYIANGFVSHNSTNLRQVAIISILGQMGSFVPAESARLPLVDRIWTRVGASDDLTRGRSTFMVEMTETAAILHNATPRSLVLLDEIGRGTSTFDGLSIAWAVAEHLHDSPEHAAKTLFATHYHELTELAERLPGAQNYQITAAEREGEVVFLHRLEKGRASKSYGIEVARLAGLPPSVIERARDVLARLEHYELDVFADDEEKQQQVEAQQKDEWNSWAGEDQAVASAARRAGRRRAAAQSTLFEAVNFTLLDELRNIDVETLTPEEAREILLNIQKRIV